MELRTKIFMMPFLSIAKCKNLLAYLGFDVPALMWLRENPCVLTAVLPAYTSLPARPKPGRL